MKTLKIQTEILKDWFDFRTKDRTPKWKACEYKGEFYVTDNKVLVRIPGDQFFLRIDDETPKLYESSVERFTKEPYNLEVYEKTAKLETYSDFLALVYEPKLGDRKPVQLNKKYMDYFDSNCIVKTTRPDYPVYIYELNAEGNEVFRAILMTVQK